MIKCHKFIKLNKNLYRKITWENGVVFALVGFIIFILSLIYKYQSSSNPFDLVTEKYYEEELLYQDEIDAYNRTNLLDSIPMYSISEKGILVQFPKKIIYTEIEILLRHPSKKSSDIKSQLLIDSQWNFLIPSKFLEPSLYSMKIKWKDKNLNYRKDYEVQWK